MDPRSSISRKLFLDPAQKSWIQIQDPRFPEHFSWIQVDNLGSRWGSKTSFLEILDLGSGSKISGLDPRTVSGNLGSWIHTLLRLEFRLEFRVRLKTISLFLLFALFNVYSHPLIYTRKKVPKMTFAVNTSEIWFWVGFLGGTIQIYIYICVCMCLINDNPEFIPTYTNFFPYHWVMVLDVWDAMWGCSCIFILQRPRRRIFAFNGSSRTAYLDLRWGEEFRGPWRRALQWFAAWFGNQSQTLHVSIFTYIDPSSTTPMQSIVGKHKWS